MVALVTSGEGVPQFLQPLDGNASDRCALLEVISTPTQHLQESGETPGIYVADGALYGTENILLVCKLAEVRVRQRLAATGQTVPDRVRKPTARPTMRWLFQCFEGIDLHHTLLPGGSRWTEVPRLADLHRLVLRLLGPGYEIRYSVFHETAE